MKGDPKVIDHLNEALRHELTAVNQYWRHYRLFDNWGMNELATQWREESIEEMLLGASRRAPGAVATGPDAVPLASHRGTDDQIQGTETGRHYGMLHKIRVFAKSSLPPRTAERQTCCFHAA
jgi:Ferritin-like domain